MKIIIKTLSGQNFPLEVEGTDTVLEKNYFIIDSLSQRKNLES